MIRGIQSAASGMIAQMVGQEATANNLANANTSGFKRDVPSFDAVLSGYNGAAPTSQIASQSSADFSQGTLMQTEDNFNLALEGKGFFSIQRATGTAYTRDGSFALDRNGYLVTKSGDRLLGKSGPIRLSTGSWAVSEDGQVTQAGRVIDTLKIVQFNSPQNLQKLGDNLWGGSNPQLASETRVRQGYLESSNVNAIGEMVNMMTSYRTYEASQKVIQAQDETLDKAVNEVGRT